MRRAGPQEPEGSRPLGHQGRRWPGRTLERTWWAAGPAGPAGPRSDLGLTHACRNGLEHYSTPNGREAQTPTWRTRRSSGPGPRRGAARSADDSVRLWPPSHQAGSSRQAVAVTCGLQAGRSGPAGPDTRLSRAGRGPNTSAPTRGRSRPCGRPGEERTPCPPHPPPHPP